MQVFFKENVDLSDSTWPDLYDSRDLVFSEFRDPTIIFSDARDLNRVPKMP